MVHVLDRLTLDKGHRTADGYYAVRAKAARTGLYDYVAGEIGAPADRFKATDRVKVLREESEVFAEDAVRSFLAKPITNDHPRDAVTSDNWRDHARGVNMGAMRDGDYLAFDLVLMDRQAISDVESGKRELSNGYACDFDWTPGEHPKFGAYDARQTRIRGNHVAIVDKGRAGPDCAIKDGERFAICDANPSALKPEKTMKTITLDGLPVNLGDEAAVEAAIKKLQDQAAAAADALKDAKTEHDKALAAKDAEIDGLKAKAVDQAQIDALADAKAEVVGKAKAVCGDKLGDTAGKTVAEVRRMACDAAGIEVADKSDDYIEARFDALTADVKDAVVDIGRAKVGDADTTAIADAYDAMVKDMTDRKPANTIAA
jgi:hypothetical protein